MQIANASFVSSSTVVTFTLLGPANLLFRLVNTLNQPEDSGTRQALLKTVHSLVVEHMACEKQVAIELKSISSDKCGLAPASEADTNKMAPAASSTAILGAKHPHTALVRGLMTGRDRFLTSEEALQLVRRLGRLPDGNGAPCGLYSLCLAAKEYASLAALQLLHPSCQRPYEWEADQADRESNVVGLLEDAREAMERGRPFHLLNAAVLSILPNGPFEDSPAARDTSKPLECELLDGVQRSTTLTITYCVVAGLGTVSSA